MDAFCAIQAVINFYWYITGTFENGKVVIHKHDRLHSVRERDEILDMQADATHKTFKIIEDGKRNVIGLILDGKRYDVVNVKNIFEY